MTKPIIALLYDFDKTLCTTDMEDYAFIPALGYTPAEFWHKANTFGRENRMDGLLAYMYTMIVECRAQGKDLKRDFLVACGRSMELFPGVREWFQRINAFGEQQGVTIEHYVLSSGLKEIIEGSGIAHEFKQIYACEFYYDEAGAACWPKLDVNFTNKTQFVYRINKGVLDVSNDRDLNASMPDDSKRVPFTNMIYIGDSDTDIPCMKLVNSYGGHSIGVYNAETRDKSKVYKMMREGRIRYFAPADYSEGTQLDELVKAIIDRTATNERLEGIHFRCKKENIEADKQNSAEELEKTDSLISLENSRSFTRTHEVIKKLSRYNTWSPAELSLLFRIAANNSQVRYIIRDTDVKLFYSQLLGKVKKETEEVKIIRELLENEE